MKKTKMPKFEKIVFTIAMFVHQRIEIGRKQCQFEDELKTVNMERLVNESDPFCRTFDMPTRGTPCDSPQNR